MFKIEYLRNLYKFLKSKTQRFKDTMAKNLANTTIPKIILDHCHIFKSPHFKGVKPTYRNVQNIILTQQIRIDIFTIKKLFQRIEIFLNRPKDESSRMIHHFEKFPELEDLTFKEQEELMLLSIELNFHSAIFLWIASDIGRDRSRYNDKSIKAFDAQVVNFMKNVKVKML